MVLLAVCVGAAVAQTAVDGAIAGHVLAQNGKPIAAARVRLRAPDGTGREIQTRRDGSFLFLRLPPGEYALDLVNGAHTQVVVEVGDIAEVTLRANSAHVEAATDWENAPDAVPSEERSVDSRQEESGGENTEQREERNTDEKPSQTSPTRLSFHGLSPTQNVFLVDGVATGRRFDERGSTYGESSISEFRVRNHRYSAQYGGSGGMVSAVSPNPPTFHAGTSYIWSGSPLAATNPYSLSSRYRNAIVTTAPIKPQNLNQELRLFLHGPAFSKLFRGRLTGFVSAEQQWRNSPAVSSPRVTPGTANFYALTPTQVALLGNRGVTTAAMQSALSYLDSLTGEVPRRADRGVQFASAEVRVSEHDRVTLSYARMRSRATSGVGSGSSSAVVNRGTASVGDDVNEDDSATARWLHTFSSRWTHELRAHFGRSLAFEQPHAPLAQEPGIAPGGFAPEISIAGGEFVYGTPAALGRNAFPEEQRVQAADIVQWSPGRHILTAGFDWARVADRIDSLNNTNGTFVYDSGTTNGRAGGLVDWITDYTFNVNGNPNGGCPSINAAVHLFCFRSFTQSFGQQRVDFVTHEFAGFAEDVWRLRAGLTVSAGARYEYALLPLPQRPNIALDSVFGATGATSIFPEDRNNVGARVGVAWSPREGRWGSVRAGYGMYFGRLPGATVRAALEDTALASSVTRVRITPQTVTACPQVLNQGFGFPCAFTTAPPSAVVATTSAMLFARNFRLPAVQQAELSWERELGGRVSARLTYSGAIATQLLNSNDVNIAPATGLGRFVLKGGDGRVGVRDGETFVVPVYTSRVAAQFGPVTAIESNANATWHGLTMEARAKAPGGVQVRGAYTWSKALDFGAEQRGAPRVNGQFDPFNVRYDKGRAETDFPQRFTGSVVWMTALHRGPELLQRAATGWRLLTAATAGSGRPYSYEIFGGARLNGGTESINGAGGSVYLPTVGRNTLRLPVRWNVDARVGRSFHIAGRVHGTAYAEVFNVANHRNAARVNARAFLAETPVQGVTPLVFQDAGTIAAEGLNQPAFGTVTSSTAAGSRERQAQMGLRVEF